ncbi:sporulation protein YunB [Colidextribacter sp. 210702-DFI.3.9]|nr:sporulation protein YunB [Colidextribacter sp. 210702-DFI.3.9]MCG4470551.1 sporulation protein YunB [Lawsonibacter sp. DFI.6.74]MCG4774010.1 sporulation protein YunB [Lawsonibacter sp. DFI.5.51]
MSAGPWRLKLERRLRRGLPTWVLTWLVAAGVMLCAVRVTERALRPMLAAAARYQVRSQVTAAVEQWAARDLQERGVDYSDFVTITRNEAGEITALSADMARLNLLRAELSAHLLERLEDSQLELTVPVGSLLPFEPTWARGPELHLRALALGTASAEFESEFTSAGINQTRHRLWLELSVPVTVLLPGGGEELTVDSRLCVAETVIVGQVPQTWFQTGGLPADT